MPDAFSIRPARSSDRAAVLSLLASVGLPTAGVGDPLDDAYCVAERDGRLLGVAGIEPHGEFGLLRSVAVQPEARGAGVAGALVADRLARARHLGLRAVYLLTTTAARYFERRGFVGIARDSVPGPVRASGEFAHTCPQSAVVMMMVLHRPAGHPG